MKRFINWLTKQLDTLSNEEESTPNSKIVTYKGVKEERHWCPLCGYSGTADNVRCHLLNDHSK